MHYPILSPILSSCILDSLLFSTIHPRCLSSIPQRSTHTCTHESVSPTSFSPRDTIARRTHGVLCRYTCSRWHWKDESTLLVHPFHYAGMGVCNAARSVSADNHVLVKRAHCYRERGNTTTLTFTTPSPDNVRMALVRHLGKG